MKSAFGTLFILILFVSHVFAQDSDFVRAKKTLDQIDNGMAYLKRGDVKSYNNLTSKLSTARDLLESTASKNDKEYGLLVNRWNAHRQKLSDIANDWQNSNQSAPQQATQVKSEQIYNDIIQKYQSTNRPTLPPEPTPEQVVEWTTQMATLLNIMIPQDTATMASHVSAGRVNQNDKNKFDRWVLGTWKRQIIQEINQVQQSFEGQIANALNQAEFINKADLNDTNSILNIGGGNNYANNSQLLINGLTYLAYAGVLDSVLNNQYENKRENQRQSIENAQLKLQTFYSKVSTVKEQLAKTPNKPKKQLSSQKLWLNGSVIAEITGKGEVWINGTYAGTISDDGKIWVSRNNDYGSIEKNGEVWHNGNYVGVISANGDVHSKVKKSGSISKDGKVWYGTQVASIEGPGDWRRAAIIYFFDFF